MTLQSGLCQTRLGPGRPSPLRGEASRSHRPLSDLPHPSVSRAPPGCMSALTSPSPPSPSEPAIRCGLWPGMALHSTGAPCLPPSQLVSDTHPPHPHSGGVWVGGFLLGWWPCLLFSSEGIFWNSSGCELGSSTGGQLIHTGTGWDIPPGAGSRAVVSRG